MRFAGGSQLVKQIAEYGLPRNLGEAAGRFGPDLAFSALYAATVPGEYANGMERAGLFAEDLLTQSVPGILASGLGGMAARRLGADHATAAGIANALDMGVSIAAPMAAGPLGLRPMSRALDEKARKNAELQAQLEREGIFQQGLMAGAQSLGQTPMVAGLDNALAGLYG